MAPAPKQGQQQGQGQQRGGPLVFEQFAGINTATVRSGVPDEQAYWLDNFMPLAPRQLRTMWGLGSSIFTAPGGLSIIFFAFYNIGPTSYAAVFLSDGSVIQVNPATNATAVILPAASIQNPSTTTVGISQYGQQYLLIVSTQMNGYWIWDGMVVYSAGSLAPGVTLTNVGAGYVTPPLVIATGGHGGGATFAAQIANGVVTNVQITNPGHGWLGSDQASSVTSVSLVFSGGNQAGTGASLVATMAHSAGGSGANVQPVFVSVGGPYVQLTNVSIVSGGSAYATYVQAFFQNGNGQWVNNGIPTLQPQLTGTSITGVAFFPASSNPNALWQVISAPLPSITVVDNGYFSVASVSVVAAGSGYGPNAAISVSGGGVTSAAAFSPILSGGTTGSVTGVITQTSGVYSTSVAPTLTVTDSAVNAAGIVSLMPFGISGSAVQTYSGHVWVFNGNVFNFTAPGSVSNFATSAGGGSQQSSDNFLRVRFTQAVQSNGFLFVLADSSMNYISGVVTSGTPPTTTFTNQNSDPEIGAPYPYAVASFGQDIFAANSAGVFVSSGGGFVKRSEALDGVYNSVPNFGGLQLSVAKATIFGKRVWMVLAPIVDPVTGAGPPTQTISPTTSGNVLTFSAVPGNVDTQTFVYDSDNTGAIPPGTTVLSMTTNTVTLSNSVLGSGVASGDHIYFFKQKLLMTNGRQWWTATQENGLNFIGTQEINSIFQAWGTDGVRLFPLFAQPSSSLRKIATTKYWDDPGYEGTKAVSRFWSLWQVYNTSNTTFTLTLDAVGLDANNNQFFLNSANYLLNANGALQSVMPTISQAVGQQGILIGMTFQTTAPDMALISAKLLPDLYQYRG